MEELVRRVVARYLEAAGKEVPVINKDKDRIVYVLPETMKDKPGEYEPVPKDKHDHIFNKGYPQKPAKPRRPRRPKKPKLPRNLHPAPVRPPIQRHPALPAPPVKPVKPVPLVKAPSPEKKKEWKVIKKENPVEARVVERFLGVD